MTEKELYRELGILTKNRDRWKERIPYVSSLLRHESVKIQAKALWLLGEMGLMYPQSVQDTVPDIAVFLDSPEPILRERALNALGRIGRAVILWLSHIGRICSASHLMITQRYGLRLSGRQRILP